MGGACGTYGGEERCIQDFGGETGGKDLGIDGRISLQCVFKKLVGVHGLD